MTTFWRSSGALLVLLGLGGCASSIDSLQTNQAADAAYHRGDLAAAEKAYTALLQKTPDNPIFWARLGNCQALLGHPEAAAHDYAEALRRNSALPTVRYNLAILRIKEARAQLISAEGDPSLPPILQDKITHLLAHLPTLQEPTGSGTTTPPPEAAHAQLPRKHP
jgi:tetratricopeptide (TPR) repeat protein